MALKISEELAAQLKASADQSGRVSFSGTGMLGQDGMTLEVESVNDIPVAYAGEDEAGSEDAAEDKAEGEDQGKPAKEDIMAMFQRGMMEG
jgi:hypothetical protein